MSFDRVTARVRRARRRATSTSSSTGSRTPTTATPSATTAARAPPRRCRRSAAGSTTSCCPTGSSRRPARSAGRSRRRSRRIAKISSRALSARTYTDIPYKVFTSPRRVRFVEMEYAVPREAAVDALRELQGDGRALRPADQLPGGGADRAGRRHHAVHRVRPRQRLHRGPHVPGHAAPGVLHRGRADHDRASAAARTGASCTPATRSTCAGVYPRFGEFTALRDRLDPERLFGNDYLRRVLGS